MHFLFRVGILFLIVFNFRVPFLYNTAFVTIAICSIYYFITRKRILFTFFFQRYTFVILLATVVLAFIVSFIGYIHNTEFLPVRAKRIWVELMMLWSVIYAMPLLVEGKESSAHEEIILIICYAFAIQGIISLAAYLYDPLAQFLIELKPDSIKFGEAEDSLDNRFRFLNLSGIVLVELAAAYGVALIAFYWLMLNSNHKYLRGWKKFAVLFFLLIGTSFAGRTGFIGFVMGFSVWLFFSLKKILIIFQKNFLYLTVSVLIVLFSYYFLLSGGQREAFNNELFPFAFEWYYNYQSYGKFSIGSMEATPDHYFTIFDETLYSGHGIDAYGGGTKYRHSDAGYMNTLVYGGIPFLFSLIVYQSLYTIRPLDISIKNFTRNNRINFMFFLLLFAYIFIVEIKTAAVGYMHIVEVLYIAIGSSYVMQYYTQKKKTA